MSERIHHAYTVCSNGSTVIDYNVESGAQLTVADLNDIALTLANNVNTTGALTIGGVTYDLIPPIYILTEDGQKGDLPT